MAQTGVSTWSSFIPAKKITWKLHLPGALTDSRDQPNFLYHKKYYSLYNGVYYGMYLFVSDCIMIVLCMLVFSVYSKTPLLRPPLDLRKNGLYSGVVLLLS